MRIFGRPCSPLMRSRARLLRRRRTEAEQLLWAHLRRCRLDGLHFRRQQPLGPYVVDFYVHASKLVIEVDGSQHGEDASLEADRARDEFLATLGLRVLRISNADVLTRLDWVLARIHQLARDPELR